VFCSPVAAAAAVCLAVSGSCGSIWSVAGSEVLSLVAYVSDGGLLGILPMEPPTGEGRHRKSHAALSAVAVDDDQLWLLSAREVPGNGGLYENGEALRHCVIWIASELGANMCLLM
jgi:hypothetical protein